MYVPVWGLCAHECRAHENQERVLDLPELEWLVAVSSNQCSVGKQTQIVWKSSAHSKT